MARKKYNEIDTSFFSPNVNGCEQQKSLQHLKQNGRVNELQSKEKLRAEDGHFFLKIRCLPSPQPASFDERKTMVLLSLNDCS
ncbi:hypothetical protein CEXT_649401 [Caerostris extrusa]|uniref:Uncharacterized protein n=1 Tax=Caerostris extrusa TaxID=172846 RepID=A0AAV4RMS9_CAEEX|nr:hypothetical protein CEXT_649401 [Caerostris extrusa]